MTSAIATKSDARRDDPVSNRIDGEWIESSAAESLPVEDPGTGERLGSTPLSPAAEVDEAVRAAREAFPEWRETPAVERARVLFRLKALLEEHQDELAALLSSEHGKTVEECRGELRRGIENVEHACGTPNLMMGETLEDVAPGIDCEAVRQPLGVFGAITPYNFPVMIPLWFWPYAVATGNTFVLKPSAQDPLTHQRVVGLAAEAGLPAGVLNVVHGDEETAEALVEHPDVKGISSVGSSASARLIYRNAAAEGKRVQALGGAKNHIVVMPDADYELAARSVVSSVYGSAGQRCLAGSVVVGVEDAYPEMKSRVLDRISSFRVGYGQDEGVDMGPLISREHRDRVLNYIDRGEEEGAELHLDGRDVSVDDYPEGHWVGPTLFGRVDPEMDIGREEIFGPVGSLMEASSLEDAVEQIHENQYGNATSIFTRSGRAAREFRYRAGISMIGVNIGVAAPMAFFPFGGSRNSFFGDLKAQGRESIEFYTDRRVVISRW